MTETRLIGRRCGGLRKDAALGDLESIKGRGKCWSPVTHSDLVGLERLNVDKLANLVNTPLALHQAEVDSALNKCIGVLEEVPLRAALDQEGDDRGKSLPST